MNVNRKKAPRGLVNKEEIEDDIIPLEEDEQDTKSIHKMRQKLSECEERAREYLDGWQRARADFINQKKAHTESLALSDTRIREDFARALLPVLDSFSMAIESPAWNTLPSDWTRGMEGICDQLLSIFGEYGIVSFGEAGDAFNPAIHDAVGGEGERVSSVLTRGYKCGERILRPASVIVSS